MARIRSIKPEFWRNYEMSSVSAEAALLAIGLLNFADDEGYFKANPKMVQADVFPLRDLSNDTTVLLRELSDTGYLRLFLGSDGHQYGVINKFNEHQVINKATPSKIKQLEDPDRSGSTTVVLPLGKERKGSNKAEQKIAVSKPKTKDVFDSRKFMLERGVDDQLATDVIAHRKKKGAAETLTAYTGIVREAEKANVSLSAALTEMVSRNWQGVKADWLTANQQTSQQTFLGETL